MVSKIGIGLALLAGGGVLLAASRAAAAVANTGGSGPCPGELPWPIGLVTIARVDITHPVPGQDLPGNQRPAKFWRVRSDVAPALRSVVKVMGEVGAQASSSGGMRSLDAPVTTGRVAASAHHIGCAVDFWMYGGMVEPSTDPYIVIRDDERQRLFRVYARCKSGGAVRTLNALRSGAPPINVTARVIDLTALLECHGLHRIPCSQRVWDGIETDRSLHRELEWWHFQRFIPNGTRFGDELVRIHPLADLIRSATWALSDWRWRDGRFVEPGVA